MRIAGYNRPRYRAYRTAMSAEQILFFLQSRGIRVAGREGQDGVEVRLDKFCFDCGPHKTNSPCYVNLQSQVYFCHSCGKGGSMQSVMRNTPGGLMVLAGGKAKFQEPEQQIDSALPEKWHKALFEDEKYLQRFAKWRCLDIETLRKAKIGITHDKGYLEVTVPYIRHGRARYAKLFHWPKEGKKKIRRFPAKSGHFPYGIDDIVIDKTPGTSNRVVVVEGEFDRLVLHQAGVKNVVSTPDGAANAREDWLDYLEPFDQIVLAYDRDEEGQAGIERIAKKLGEYRCFRVEWPDVDGQALKDVTEFARAGAMDACLRAVEQAEPMGDPTMLSGDGAADVLREEFASRNKIRGTSTGFKKLDRYLGGGWRTGEVTMWTGFSGVGKSAMLLNVGTSAALRGVPVLFASFELTVGHTVRRITQRLSGKWFNNMLDENGNYEYDPTEVLNASEADEVASKLGDLPIYILNHFGAFPIEEFVRVVEYGARRYGIKFVALDHIHYMLDDNEQDVSSINKTMRELTNLAKRADVSIHAVSHTRKPSQGQTKATGYDMLGSMRLRGDADNVLIVSALEQEPGDMDIGVFPASVTIDKFRETSCRSGVVNMTFVPRSHSYVERGSLDERQLRFNIEEGRREKVKQKNVASIHDDDDDDVVANF